LEETEKMISINLESTLKESDIIKKIKRMGQQSPPEVSESQIR
jgi:hypothetical protein